MSGTTTTAAAAAVAKREAIYNSYIAAIEYGTQIFNGKRGEYGIYKFADPHRQMTYEHHETRFKKMQKVKNAYDKQELLRRMRADMRREYLTRKNQMKRLQMDAAVDFRNAESSLQAHYASEAAADHHPYIHAPLVSKIQLPNAQILDLKTFDAEREFAKVRQIHADLLADQQESIRLFDQEEQRQSQYYAIQQRWMEREYGQRRPDEQPRGDDGVGEEEIKTENRWECRHDANCSTCGRDDDGDSYKGDEAVVHHGRAFTWSELVAGGKKQQQQEEEEEPQGRYGDGGYCGCGDFECSDCFSYGGDDKDSYDSDYCGPFGHYPREYNWEIECREAEEAAAAAQAAVEAAEQQRWEENTRDSDGETWDEEARSNEAEHRREVALMKLNDDMTYTCDDHPDVQQLEVVAITEPKARITASAASSGGISAQKKAAAGAAKKAAKARQAKQELKKKEKFVPFKIIANTNRVPVPVSKEYCDVEDWSGNEDDVEQPTTTATTLLYRGKAQVNLPKKNLQNVSREGKKRHIAIWRRIEAAEKHASARGTRIANIPEPMAWYNCGGSDIDCDYEI
jgi:hypothetical protein